MTRAARTFVIVALATMPATLRAEEAPTADQLYERFREARLSIARAGPAATLDFYSRERLEVALKSAFHAAERPSGGADYVKASLWAAFQGLGITSAVYSYRLLQDSNGPPTLEMYVTTNMCGEKGADHPSKDTYTFIDEGGAWRVLHEAVSTVPKDISWYRPSLEPKERFPYFQPLDRTEVWREFFHELGRNTDVKSPCIATTPKPSKPNN